MPAWQAPLGQSGIASRLGKQFSLLNSLYIADMHYPVGVLGTCYTLLGTCPLVSSMLLIVNACNVPSSSGLVSSHFLTQLYGNRQPVTPQGIIDNINLTFADITGRYFCKKHYSGVYYKTRFEREINKFLSSFKLILFSCEPAH